MSDRMFYIVIILLIVLLGLVMLVAWVSDFGLEDDGYPDPAVGDYSSTVSREFVYEEETIELDKVRFKGYAFQIEMKFTADIIRQRERELSVRP